MFDIGWAEFLIIGVVGLIVIGPRDLPDMFRTIGRFTAKLRSMSRDFQRAMDTAAAESGVKDVAQDLKTMTSARNLGLDKVKEAATKFEKWDPLKPKSAAPPKVAAAAAATPAVATPAATVPVETIAAPPAPSVAMGPATQALADKVAAKKAILSEAADKLRAVSTEPQGVPAAVAAAERKPGRVRSKAVPVAEVAPSAAAKPAPKAKTRKTQGDA